MFCALNTVAGRSINALAETSPDQVEALRLASRTSTLQCDYCKEIVIYRHGDVLRPHFAHKDTSTCPRSHESAQLLEARASLYAMLSAQFPGDVAIEMKAPGSCPVPILDCWVTRKSGGFGYLLLEHGMRSADQRQALDESFHRDFDGPVYPVFLGRMLREIPGKKNTIRLTPTERFFISQRVFDRMYANSRAPYGGSLHYLQTDFRRLRLVSYRCLRPSNCGGHYCGLRLSSAVENVVVARGNGELTHFGERTAIQWYVKVLRARHNAALLRQRTETEIDSWKAIPNGRATPAVVSASEVTAICELCGTMTNDWIIYNGATRSCKCRGCYYSIVWPKNEGLLAEDKETSPADQESTSETLAMKGDECLGT
jgi:hypothetical protein